MIDRGLLCDGQSLFDGIGDKIKIEGVQRGFYSPLKIRHQIVSVDYIRGHLTEFNAGV